MANATRSRFARLDWRRLVFTLLALVPVAIYVVLFQMWRNQALIVTSWFGGFGLLPDIFYHEAHRLHEYAAAIMVWPLLVGLLAQVKSPRRYVAGMLMALVSLAGILLAIGITGGWEVIFILVFLGVPTLLATLVHPAGLDLFRSLSASQVNKVALALVVVAAVPILAFTAHQVGLQTGAIEPAHDHAGGGHDAEIHQQHVEHHHFMFVIAFLLTVLGVGLVASLRPPGWRLAAVVAGLMMATYAVGGVLAPKASSNFGLAWNLAAVVWAVAFAGTAFTSDGSETPTPYGPRGADSNT